jgi:hypothetical protein
MSVILSGHGYELQNGLPHTLMDIRGLVAQLIAFSHAVGLSHIHLPTFALPARVDRGLHAAHEPASRPMSAQMRRRPEVLSGCSPGMLLGNAPPALSGYCGNGIVTTEIFSSESPGYVRW